EAFRVMDRLPIRASFQPLGVSPRILAQSPFVCAGPPEASSAHSRTLNNQEFKKATYVTWRSSIGARNLRSTLNKKGNTANETPNQCAGKRARLGKLAPGRRRLFPLSKQGAELHYCGKSWSLDRLRANANWPRHRRTAIGNAWTGALGRHEDKQL